ncbi:TonB-dependent receptor domain-containing protein [Caenibius tardaugens]|nr:TonB-dependent receptor [Caenibius tardaugens]
MFSDSEVRGKYAPALNGRYTADEALDRLLTGSGLVHKTVRGKVVVIQRAATISAAVNARETVRQAPRLAAASEPDFAEAGPAAGAVGIEEIVVTAQKREQNLQDVPIAISAISPAFLEKREITSISSLTSLAPNLKVESAAGNRTTSIISIRGGAQGNAQIYFEPSVGLYLDGVYIAKAQGTVFDVADIERIEVLRGPQGTLYGRNAVAGAVSIVTKKPSGELGGKAELSYGNYDYRRARGTLDLPAFGIFSVKLSGQMTKRDGFYDVSGNAYTDEAQAWDSKSGMIQVRAQPSSALTLDYTFDISVAEQQTGPVHAVSGTGSLAPYVLPRKRQKHLSFDGRNHEYSKNWGHALIAALDLGEVGVLKSITAVRKQHYRDALDLDGTPIAFAASSREIHYKQFSQELQLTGKTGRLNYVLGGYYFDDKGHVDNPQSYFSGLSRTEGGYGFTTKAYAAYAQLDYQLTDALTLTGGLRYTNEKKTVERHLTRITGAGSTVVIDLPAGATPPAKFEKVSPTVTLAYEVSPTVNVYARYAQGFRSGGFNATANTTADTQYIFKPQVQNTYEIGFKSRLLDNKLQLNVAAFQNDIDDLQLSVFVPGLSASSVLVNAGKARVRGVEVEAVARPTDRLLLQAGVGYLHSKYLEYIDNGVNVANNRTFTHAPKWTVSATADWAALKADWGKLNLIADLGIVSDYYSAAAPLKPTSATQTPAEATRAPSRAMLDARLVLSELAVGNAHATISLWGKNLLNEKDPNFLTDYGASFQRLIAAYFPDPRTYGVTAAIKF